MTYDLDDHPVYHMLTAPWARTMQALSESWAARIMAGGMAVAQAAWFDAFLLFAALGLVTAITDTLYGRRLHKLIGDYDPIRAEIGLHGKMAGLTMAWVIRALEWGFDNRIAPALTDMTWVQTSGLFATAMVVTLVVQDLASIQEKRERFGQRPIPVFTFIMKHVDSLLERVVGIPSNAELQNRRAGDTQHEAKAESS